MRIAKWSALAILAAGCGATPLPSAYGGSNPCVPLTCAAAIPGCGVHDDACGGSIDCGPCEAPPPQDTGLQRPTVSTLPPPTDTAPRPPPDPVNAVPVDAVLRSEVGAACLDGIDNDGDGNVDDLDSDCGAAKQ